MYSTPTNSVERWKLREAQTQKKSGENVARTWCALCGVVQHARVSLGLGSLIRADF